MYDVSIIIPVYNVELYVSDCVKSVISQDCADTCRIECLIVDDCGMDNSMNIVSSIIAGYSGPIKFRIIHRDTNGGLSAARNTGIREAKGKYVFFLDSDDLITSDCIMSLFGIAQKNPGVEIVTGDFQTFPKKDEFRYMSLKDKNFPEYTDDKTLIRNIFLAEMPVTAWNKLISRIFIIDNNLFFKEGILHEDNHWMAMAYHVITNIAFLNRVVYLYRMRIGSIIFSEGASTRRYYNYANIYAEMFTKKVVWDRPWAKWVFEGLLYLKFGNTEIKHTNSSTARCVCRLLLNKSCPFSLKTFCSLFLLPKKLISIRILCGGFNRLLHII